MATLETTAREVQRSQGRAFFWAGIGAGLLGPALAAAQFSLKHLFVPWYSPVLATFAVVLLLVAVARRRSILRVGALVAVATFAGLQWYILVVVVKLPAYEGTTQPGEPFPAFHSSLSDGRPFTEVDLRDGSRRAMVFFRGRW
jgi:hypothetical protein